jgi:hypothetical protein
MKTRTLNYKVTFRSKETLMHDEYILEPIYFLNGFGALFEKYSTEHPVHLSVSIDKVETQVFPDAFMKLGPIKLCD